MESILLAIDADNTGQSSDYREESRREIASLEREFAEARAQTSDLMQNQTRAMLELQSKWHAALWQRDALVEVLREIASGDYSWTNIVDYMAPKALAAVKGESHE